MNFEVTPPWSCTAGATDTGHAGRDDAICRCSERDELVLSSPRLGPVLDEVVEGNVLRLVLAIGGSPLSGEGDVGVEEAP
jgi:hypothetical protein